MNEPVATPECCADDSNLDLPEEMQREGVTVRVCRECGRRHFEVVAEPGDLRADAP